MSFAEMDNARDQISKVSQVTFAFWMMKILATTLGETAGDFLSMSLDLGYYVGLAITFAILVALLFLQVKSEIYRPLLFWFTIIATTTAGTEISDFMDRSLGLGYLAGSVILATALALALIIWRLREGTIRVYPVRGRDVEIMFWTAVLLSNSLGTAFGDYLVDDAGLSFIQGALVTAGIIGVVAFLHYFARINDVILFWIAFVFTRPFGATFGDFLTKPIDAGGLSLPRGQASLVTLGLLLLILYLSLDRRRSHVSRHG